ncbi:hypothetical protein [Azohydromonas aeria]|uniref:hypothetical protein n=1 Tax=Azohydromonas aeria TaxID=2590212 RepID=UPI0012FB97D7|nr:hypothetical protein [Azohydromonas aeria]
MKAFHATLMQLLSVAIPVLLFQSVATRHAAVEVSSRPVPVERIRWMPALASNEPVATLHVIREARARGRAMPTLLTLDGREVAEIRDGENLLLRLPPGPHVLGLRHAGQTAAPDGWSASGRGSSFSETVLQFGGGRYHDLRIVPAAGPGWRWELDRPGS